MRGSHAGSRQPRRPTSQASGKYSERGYRAQRIGVLFFLARSRHCYSNSRIWIVASIRCEIRGCVGKNRSGEWTTVLTIDSRSGGYGEDFGITRRDSLADLEGLIIACRNYHNDAKIVESADGRPQRRIIVQSTDNPALRADVSRLHDLCRSHEHTSELHPLSHLVCRPQLPGIKMI